MCKVYISGPIAGLDIAERKKAFASVSELLSSLGYEPVNPFNNGVSDTAEWREHMLADIKLLTGCEYIYMMSSWYKSKGCKLELDVATSCGIKIFNEMISNMTLL